VLTEDAQRRPELFRWYGRPEDAKFRAWLESNRWLEQCPPDLLKFWQETGGGDAFETETILGPSGDMPSGDDVVAVNRAMRSRGMPERFILYHTGLLMSAVDTTQGDYVELDPATFSVRRRFRSLEDWYVLTLRKEYGQRYGLGTLHMRRA